MEYDLKSLLNIDQINMKHLKSIILIITSLTFFMVNAQSGKKMDSTNFKARMKSFPSFSIYGDNFFVTGTSLNDGFTSETSDAKFVLGFKQRLSDLVLPWDTFVFFRYRQKAFWDIYKESFPFRETNYNPSIALAKLGFNDKGISYGLWLAFEHESNGRDGLESRSWNFFSAEYIKPMGTDWQLRAKAWIPVGDLSNNDDILSYRGLFYVGATYHAGKKLFLDIDVQPAYDTQLQGSIQLGASFKISKKSNQFIYIQYFGGYAEDLIDYTQDVSNLRIGIAFKDLFANFDTTNTSSTK